MSRATEVLESIQVRNEASELKKGQKVTFKLDIFMVDGDSLGDGVVFFSERDLKNYLVVSKGTATTIEDVDKHTVTFGKATAEMMVDVSTVQSWIKQRIIVIK